MVDGKEVKLEFDSTESDPDGNTFAYVYLPDGTFLNAEIIKQGYGRVYQRSSFKYIEEFLEYQDLAKENRKGIWGMASK